MTAALSPRLRSFGKSITGLTETVVYTCPDRFTAKVVLVFIANGTNGNTSVGLKWDDASNGASPYNLLTQYTISSYNFLKLSEGYLVLNAGDTLIVKTASESVIDAVVSVEEYYDPTQNG
jgi:hypothetical protein